PGAAGAVADARKKLLDGLAPKALPALEEKAGAEGSPLRALGAGERKEALHGAVEEAGVTVRLLKARVEFLKHLAQIGKGKPDWGFGRVDAFGSVRALYFQPDYVPQAPVSYPSLWAFNQNPWFHYDSNTTSVLQRNLGQALGVGAIFDKTTFSSTLRPIDSNRLEELAWKIKVPKWPADLFGQLDQEKDKKGAAEFDKLCASCHKLIEPTETAPDRLEDLKALGTDPNRALDVVADLPDTKKPFYDDLAVVLDKVTKKALDDSKVPPGKQKEFD